MDRIKQIIAKKYSIFKNTESVLILKGRLPNIDTLYISLHYNFLGLRLLKVKAKSKSVEGRIFYTSQTIPLTEFYSEQDFLNLLQKKEFSLSKILAKLINEYYNNKLQYSLFN